MVRTTFLSIPHFPMEQYEFELEDVDKSLRRELRKEAALYPDHDGVGVQIESLTTGEGPSGSPAPEHPKTDAFSEAAKAIDKKPACSVTLRDIEVRYGFGMFVYFDFLRMLFFINLLILVPCLLLISSTLSHLQFLVSLTCAFTHTWKTNKQWLLIWDII